MTPTSHLIMSAGANDFQTPEWVCALMVKHIPASAWTILEPTPGEGNLVKAIKAELPFSYVTVYEGLPYHCVDCVVANPPFTPMKVGYEMLDTFFKLSDNIIILMPWLALINSQKRTKNYIEHGLKQIIHLPRSAFARSRVQTCILIFEKGYRGEIVFEAVEGI